MVVTDFNTVAAVGAAHHGVDTATELHGEDATEAGAAAAAAGAAAVAGVAAAVGVAAVAAVLGVAAVAVDAGAITVVTIMTTMTTIAIATEADATTTEAAAIPAADLRSKHRINGAYYEHT